MKTAIIGAGRMGRRHIAAVERVKLELAGIADVATESLALARKDNGVAEAKLFSDPAAMLEKLRPELVIIATTAPAHCDLTLAALAAGARTILCEKPMATSLAACDRMIAAAEKAGARLAINHPMRFLDQYREVQRVMSSPAVGGLTSMTCVAGNAGLAMNGTHLFELFRFLTGEPASAVSAWFSPGKFANPRGAQFDDRAGAIRLATASGKRFYLEAGADQGHGFSALFAGPTGQLSVDLLKGEFRLSARQESERGQPLTRYGCPSDEKVWNVAAGDPVSGTVGVLEALLAGRDYPTGREARAAIATLVAAYLSDERGHVPVAVAEAEAAAQREFPWP